MSDNSIYWSSLYTSHCVAQELQGYMRGKSILGRVIAEVSPMRVHSPGFTLVQHLQQATLLIRVYRGLKVTGGQISLSVEVNSSAYTLPPIEWNCGSNAGSRCHVHLLGIDFTLQYKGSDGNIQ